MKVLQHRWKNVRIKEGARQRERREGGGAQTKQASLLVYNADTISLKIEAFRMVIWT